MKNFTNIFQKFTYLFVITISFIAIGVLFCNVKIFIDSDQYVYKNIDEVPYNKVALVLGTSKYISKGKENPYFTNRMDAAVQLYIHGKVTYFLLSGDNSNIYYNEPITMKKALIERGIPDSLIFLDYAGFRTLDAVIRSKEIFGQKSITIVSQQFHNERAVYISRKKGIDAIAFNAEDVSGAAGFKTRFRELFARVKVFLDLYLTNKQPKFLGDKIKIGESIGK